MATANTNTEKKSVGGNNPQEQLKFHIQEVLAGRRRFETAAQAVSRMILEEGVEKITRCGKQVYDYRFFRKKGKHIIGWYGELNALVHFIKDAAEGGSAAEMAAVLVSEPGSGKTFGVEYICSEYRRFLLLPGNTRYTFSFIGLDKALEYDHRVATLPSMTFEDPMVLATNLFPDVNETKEFLAKIGFKDNEVEALYANHRPLGASTEYLHRKLIDRYGEVEKLLENIKVVPVPMSESLGTVTGKYSSKDKITSSAVDLVGEESLQLMLFLPLDDPNRFDLQRGALARVAGGGIHFSDEIFKNKTDLVKIYLGVIQNRNIEVDGRIWPIDTLIIATSNNEEYNKFVSQPEESPIVDRCRIIYVGHNTDYKLQHTLTEYSLGSKKKTTILGETMHVDPNLIPAVSFIATLTRLLRSEKINNPIDMMKLEAGEVAGNLTPEALQEVKDTANASPDVTKRWGQKGLGHRDVGRILQILSEMESSNENRCLSALDAFEAAKRVVLDYVGEEIERKKYMDDILVHAKRIYREKIKSSVYNAFMEDPQAIQKAVMAYVNMIIGIIHTKLGPDKVWRYKDSSSGEIKTLKIDERYIDAVERRIGGLDNKDAKEAFRNRIRNFYASKIPIDPNYDFMDEQRLVKAVAEVKTESDTDAAGSLIGALGNLTNEENLLTRNRMISVMTKKLGYCQKCAGRTIQYWVEGKKDES